MTIKSRVFLALVLGVSAIPTSTALAQQYNDPARETFATQGCKDGTWEDQGYDTYLDCYHAWYNSYPNQPFPDP